MDNTLMDKRLNILAIDDTPANLMTLGAALAGEFRLQIATSGAMGLALAAKSLPELILLDVMMPEMDGFETCRRLKADPQLKSVPVIFVTALTEIAAETAGLALGAADFITKPINVEIAHHRIRNLVERERMRKELEVQRDLLEAQIIQRNKAEETLRENEERLRLALDAANQAWFDLDLPSGQVAVSAEYPRMIGFDPDNFVSDLSNWLANVHPEDRAALSASFQTCVADGGPYTMEYRRKTKSGDWKWIRSIGKIVEWNAASQASRMIGIHTDITQRKQMEDELKESELRYRTIANFTSDWEYWIGQDGKFRYTSPSCEQICGYSPDEFLADPALMTRIIHPEDQPLYAAHTHRTSATGAPEPIDFRIHTKGGEIRWISHVCQPVVDAAGQALGYRASNRDSTARKKVEAEILRSNAELEQFSYAISHDMRQPLRMIASYLQLLERELGNKLDAERREYLGFATDGAKRLDQMLVGLLEYSRVGRKGEPPKWIESHALLDEALLFLQPAIAEAQADIRIEGDWPKIFVSPDEMLRLMQNLIGNAVKFRLPERVPEIVVTSQASASVWHLSVADNGAGIVPDQIVRLFQVFQRLQSRSKYEGTGIGLALCRKIAERHHGRIWVESAGEGQGCVFHVELPVGTDKGS